MPKLPQKVFDWLLDHEDVRLKMEVEYDLPDVRPKNKDVDEWIENQPFDRDDLDSLIDADEASDITSLQPRVVKRKFQKGEVDAIKLNGKWFTSMTALSNSENVPS